MKHWKNTLFVSLFLSIITVLCFTLWSRQAKAEDEWYWDREFEANSGDGWSITAEGVLTLESTAGWKNCIKQGKDELINKLVIGKKVGMFYLYNIDYEKPDQAIYNKPQIDWYFEDGTPHYDQNDVCPMLQTLKIEVEEGNPVFTVEYGMLINRKTHAVVLAEQVMSNVVIPEGIKTIQTWAFLNNEMITLQMPSTLETIGIEAFANCDNLTQVIIPDSVKQLKIGAFDCSDKLIQVRLSANLERIGEEAFSFCNLSGIEIPGKVKEIGAAAFRNCRIKSVDIPGSVEIIGEDAFHNCSQLSQVVFHKGTKRIEDRAFAECTNLQSVDPPEGLTFIGNFAFQSCKKLAFAWLPDSLCEIGDQAFSGCHLTLIRIPQKLTILDYGESSLYEVANQYIAHKRTFGAHSIKNLVFAGNTYDFGEELINDASTVIFLGEPPMNFASFFDLDRIYHIYYLDTFAQAWSKELSPSNPFLVFQMITQSEADFMIYRVSYWRPTPYISASPTPTPKNAKQATPTPTIAATPDQTLTPTPAKTPKPTSTPVPTQRPTPKLTPIPSPTPITTPAPTAAEKPAFDPIILVFAGVLALVVAGIVVLGVKGKKPKKRAGKKSTR